MRKHWKFQFNNCHVIQSNAQYTVSRLIKINHLCMVKNVSKSSTVTNKEVIIKKLGWRPQSSREVERFCAGSCITNSKEMPGRILLHAQAEIVQSDCWSLLPALNKKFLVGMITYMWMSFGKTFQIIHQAKSTARR